MFWWVKRVGNVGQGLQGGISENPACRPDRDHTTRSYSDFPIGSGVGSAPSILSLSFASLYFFKSSFVIFLASQQLNLHRFFFFCKLASGWGEVEFFLGFSSIPPPPSLHDGSRARDWSRDGNTCTGTGFLQSRCVSPR